MCEEILLSYLNESESVKENKKILMMQEQKKTKKDFNKLRDRTCKPKIKEIRKYLQRKENEKIRETEKNLLKLENNLSKQKKYYDYDDIKYRGIRDVKTLFVFSIDEDYYKPIITILLLIAIILNIRVKEIKTKLSLLKDVFI